MNPCPPRFARRRLHFPMAALAVTFIVGISAARADDPFTGQETVQAKKKPNEPWVDFSTHALGDLPAEITARTDTALDPYGGMTKRKADATGFFHTAQVDGRWWLVDPDGGLFINKAVVSVAPLHSPGAEPGFKAVFGDEAHWSEGTTALLRQTGFNGTGAWSDNEALRRQSHPLVYTNLVNFMGGYGKKRGGVYQQPGHLGYPKDCIFVFDPEFEKFCEEEAGKLDATKNDPWLLGTFSDNELPFLRECLENYLALPEDDAGRRAAQDWLRLRHGAEANVKDITDADKKDFLALVVGRYYRIVSAAIKRHDPNHLYLGSRITGRALWWPEVFAAAGPSLDVLSINYYWAWTPEPEKLSMWTAKSGKPVLITEWYAKGEDTGMGNTGGAGWIVKGQRERGLFYQNFTLGLIRSKSCVGWQWFKYSDNDPANTGADPSNHDSNKGIVNVRYEPYAPLVGAMRSLNERVYTLEDYFAGRDR